MNQTMVKTHLIITDMHEEYHIKWFGSIMDANPKIENGKPVFVIRSKEGAVEVNTTDVKYLEQIARRMTNPKGRTAITTDKAYIYIKEQDNNEKLLGTLIHDRVKKFAPMYDKVYYR